MKKDIRRFVFRSVLTLTVLMGVGGGRLAGDFGSSPDTVSRVSAAEVSSGTQEAGENSSTAPVSGIPGIKVGKVIMVFYKDIAAYPGLGVEVKYKKKNKLLEIDRNNIHGKLYIGKKQMIVNNEIKYKLPAAMRLVKQKKGNPRLMLPAKKVGAVLGLNYRYDSKAGRVIYTPKKAKISSIKKLTTKPFMLMSTEEFIRFLGPIARKDYHKSGLLASVTIAQAIHESYAGCSLLAQRGNNLFGMKAYLSGNNWGGSTWKGKVFVKRTTEQYGHRIVHITDRFRKYDTVMQNVNDHSAYFINAKNGSHRRYAGLTKTKNYKKQLQIIRKGGYCTFSNYTKNLEKLIKKYHLTKYDK